VCKLVHKLSLSILHKICADLVHRPVLLVLDLIAPVVWRALLATYLTALPVPAIVPAIPDSIKTMLPILARPVTLLVHNAPVLLPLIALNVLRPPFCRQAINVCKPVHLAPLPTPTQGPVIPVVLSAPSAPLLPSARLALECLQPLQLLSF
jgi:hypothetical protein